MLAGTYATEDMKKDVKDLLKAAGTGELEARSLIYNAQTTVLREKDYVSSIKEYCEYKLEVLKITGDNRLMIAQEIANKILSLMTRYESKQLLIVLESILRLINNRKYGKV